MVAKLGRRERGICLQPLCLGGLSQIVEAHRREALGQLPSRKTEVGTHGPCPGEDKKEEPAELETFSFILSSLLLD